MLLMYFPFKIPIMISIKKATLNPIFFAKLFSLPLFEFGKIGKKKSNKEFT
jgi:hypothetical protein